MTLGSQVSPLCQLGVSFANWFFSEMIVLLKISMVFCHVFDIFCFKSNNPYVGSFFLHGLVSPSVEQ